MTELSLPILGILLIVDLEDDESIVSAALDINIKLIEFAANSSILYNYYGLKYRKFDNYDVDKEGLKHSFLYDVGELIIACCQHEINVI